MLTLAQAYPGRLRVDYALSREETSKAGAKMYIQDKVAGSKRGSGTALTRMHCNFR